MWGAKGGPGHTIGSVCFSFNLFCKHSRVSQVCIRRIIFGFSVLHYFLQHLLVLVCSILSNFGRRTCPRHWCCGRLQCSWCYRNRFVDLFRASMGRLQCLACYGSCKFLAMQNYAKVLPWLNVCNREGTSQRAAVASSDAQESVEVWPQHANSPIRLGSRMQR